MLTAQAATSHSYPHARDKPPPKNHQESPSRLRTVLYLILSLPILLSPFSLFAGIILYLFLIVAVAVYASYVAVKEFVRDNLLSGIWFPWIGADARQLPSNPCSEDDDVPLMLKNSPLLQGVFLGPPLMVYVSARGIVAATLLVAKYTFWKTVDFLPTAARLAQQVYGGAVEILQDLSSSAKTAWALVRTPVTEVAISLLGLARAAAALCSTIVESLQHMSGDMMLWSYNISMRLRRTLCWMTRGLLHVAIALLQPSAKFASAALGYMRPAFNIVLLAFTAMTNSFVGSVALVIARLATAAQSLVARVVPAILSLADHMLGLVDIYMLPHLYRCARTVVSALSTMRTIAVSAMSAGAALSGRLRRLMFPLAVLVRRAVSSVRTVLARIGTPLLATVPKACVSVLDAGCHALETGISLALQTMWWTTRQAHVIAAPIYGAVLAAAQPVWRRYSRFVTWAFSLFLAQMGEAVASAAAVFAAVRAGYRWVFSEVHRAASNAIQTSDRVGKQMARMVSSTSSSSRFKGH